MSFIAPPNSLALVDCNNFFVSCERVFNPRLLNRPVVVLSNNDGCVIARSKEAKLLGIPMGAPAFQCRDIFRAHNVVTCSSNYALYADMSQRVMEALAVFTPRMQVYSIDEAFLDVEGVSLAFLQELPKKIQKWTGIPISLGVALTKTLAKLANNMAKKNPTLQNLCLLISKERIEACQRITPVEDVWGIGRNLAKTLHSHGIWTVWELVSRPDIWVRQQLSVVGLKTVWELRGQSCLSIDELGAPKKSLICSRLFGSPLSDLHPIKEAVASYVAKAAVRLREAGLNTGSISVFLEPVRQEQAGTLSAHSTLAEPTDFTPKLASVAHTLLERVYRPHLHYTKAGVILNALTAKDSVQTDLFEPPRNTKQMHLMQTIDALNQRLGRRALKFAAEGIEQEWQMKQLARSRKFTTDWNELLTISI